VGASTSQNPVSLADYQYHGAIAVTEKVYLQFEPNQHLQDKAHKQF
jgi:hypothetical protein